jgi:hypothetical protein
MRTNIDVTKPGGKAQLRGPGSSWDNIKIDTEDNI